MNYFQLYLSAASIILPSNPKIKHINPEKKSSSYDIISAI